VNRTILMMCVAAGVLAQQAVNPDAQIQADFTKRVADYVKLRKTAREGMEKLKPTKSADAIVSHENDLAERVRAARASARQGDIFTPQISAEFARLIRIGLQGKEKPKVEKSLRRAEPVQLKTLHVNQTYPRNVPLQSTPPTLLLSLPKLPAEVEYRVVGRSLVLLDVEANLIVDFIPNLLPARADAA